MNTAVKCSMVLGFAALALSSASEAQQNTPAPAGEGQYKIGVVDRKQVFDGYNRQKQEWATLEEEKKQLQTKIDGLSDGIDKDKKRYEEDASLSAEAKEKLRDKIESDYRLYQTEFKRLQGDMDSKSRKFFARMMEDIDKAIEEIGNAENYHLILEADPKRATSVIYHSSTIDITSKVVTHLNSKS